MRKAAILLLLLVSLAGCVMPGATTTTHEIYAGGERGETFPIPPGQIVLPVERGIEPGIPAERIVVPRAIEYNGGFEAPEGEGAAGWLADGDARRASEGGRTGAAALALASGARVAQTIGGVRAGDVVFLTAHARAADPAAPTTLRASVAALDAAGAALETAPIEVVPGTEWVVHGAAPLTLPQATRDVRVTLEADGGSGVLLDDLALMLHPPGERPFANGGFEEGTTAWTVQGDARVDCAFALAPEGACALRFDHLQGGSATQRFVPEGSNVAVSLAYTSQAVGSPARWLHAELAFYGADSSLRMTVIRAHLSDAGWHEPSSLVHPVPPGTTTMELTLTTNAADPGPTWVDDVRVTWS